MKILAYSLTTFIRVFIQTPFKILHLLFFKILLHCHKKSVHHEAIHVKAFILKHYFISSIFSMLSILSICVSFVLVNYDIKDHLHPNKISSTLQPIPSTESQSPSIICVQFCQNYSCAKNFVHEHSYSHARYIQTVHFNFI
jgi:hypothetical protein